MGDHQREATKDWIRVDEGFRANVVGRGESNTGPGNPVSCAWQRRPTLDLYGARARSLAERSEVLANDVHFGNVMVNILDNAVKYSPEAPKIDVYTEVVKNNILIRVQDQGAGMSKAVLKKVFEKFYREHTGDIHNVKGHGLGLSYVKKIVEDHQGEVYAESEKGKGSTFYIKLPLI